MTQGVRAPRRSESPFDRLGARVAQQERSLVWSLERGATVWVIAHLTLGDWRLWRAVMEANSVTDALDLEGVRVLAGAPASRAAPAPFAFASEPPGAPPVVVDVASAAQLGQGPMVVGASPSLRGACSLLVEDLDEATFTIALRAPGALVAGDAVTVSLADFEGVTSDVVQLVERTLFAADGAALQVRFTLDGWLCMWLARCWPLMVEGETFGERAELVIPQQTSDLLFIGV